jgi:prepilin-type N-terminal cleavage/methylation domain-containing protein
MNKFFKARKSGFTLVELLIVTVIIGILAGLMMLMMGSATDGAEATKLINDLRIIKSAALIYYNEYESWPEIDAGYTSSAGGGIMAGAVIKSLERYMDKPLGVTYGGKIFVAYDNDSPKRVYYGLSADKLSEGAKARLKRNDTVVSFTSPTGGAAPVSFDLSGGNTTIAFTPVK